jgi:hypothetical protein
MGECVRCGYMTKEKKRFPVGRYFQGDIFQFDHMVKVNVFHRGNMIKTNVLHCGCTVKVNMFCCGYMMMVNFQRGYTYDGETVKKWLLIQR